MKRGEIMTKGFITLATGHIKYYKMALNMLKSFRLHNPDVKFAIICDKENEITAQFDDVVILEKANGNYKDKFSLLIRSPYDEAIFIEPDCLIYHNLDFFWDILSGESDFSCFGWNNGGIDCWFKTPETKAELLKIIPELNSNPDAPLFNPGYFFIRKGEKCNKMYNDCLTIADKISNDEILNSYPPILCNGKLRDDPILNIAMSINGFICNTKPGIGKCISLPSKYKIDRIDIAKGILNVTDKTGKSFTDCSLLHFSTRRANEEGLYLWQSHIVSLLYKNKNSVIAKLINNRFCGWIYSVFRYIKTRVKRIIGN